jgi:putative hydrolase of the HAD superfamily
MAQNLPKALLFDLGRVLVPFEFNRAYRAMEALTGLDSSEIRRRLAATSLFREFETGLMEPEAFAREVMRVLGFECGLGEFSGIWNSIFLPETLVPEAVIRDLQSRYRLIIVSNTNQLHFEMLRNTYVIFEYFYGYILSYQVRAMKPDPAFYAAALDMAGCLPHECIFIDDLPENVDGAKVAGFDGIVFQSFPQLAEELKSRGVLLAQ